MSPDGRDLARLMDDLLGADPGPVLSESGPSSALITRELNEGVQAGAVLASLFWSCYTQTDHYRATVLLQGANLNASRPILLVHASGTRFDLLVFDASSGPDEPEAVTLTAPQDDNSLIRSEIAAVASERAGLLSRRLSRVGAAVDAPTTARAVSEVAQTGLFGVVVASRPQEIETWAPFSGLAPSPAMAVCQEQHARPVSTVGFITADESGRLLATTANHAIRDPDNVSVAGSKCTVLDMDQVTDSCLLQLTAGEIQSSGLGRAGPLRGKAPRFYEETRFDGATSGLKQTILQGCDLSVLDAQHYFGSKIYTSPVTLPGDSGAALIDEDDHIIGFAATRSAFEARIAYSTWIWAEQVLVHHGLITAA